MKHFFFLISTSVLLAGAAVAQDLTNAGGAITVQTGATLYVGTGGLSNQAGSTLTNAGTLRIDGPLINPGSLDLGAGALEVRGDLTNTGTLTSGTSPVTFSGTTDQLLNLNGASLYQVLVNKTTTGANTLLLANNLTVSNGLSLTNGFINTKVGATVNTLSLPNGATLSGEGTGRYVLGALQITRSVVSGTAVDFGHGAILNPNTNNLGTVSITRTAGLSTADVSFGQSLATSSLKGIDRIWTVSAATLPSAAVQLTLNWLADDDNGLTSFTQAWMWQQPAAGQPWTKVGTVADGSARSISMSPTVLNRFTVSNAANPLPVTLLDFTAQAEGQAAVALRWATATELNNAGFTVERSLDAHAFQTIGTVAGAGTNAVRHDYTLLDAKLPAGATLIYYRLRQIDQNGDFAYSPVRSVALTPQAAGFVVYPSRVPTGQVATYRYTGAAQPGTLTILDMLGRTMRTIVVDGRAQGEVPLAGLASGSYLLRYSTAAASYGVRCVVE